MNIALVGGTHGNEPVGIEVMNYFDQLEQSFFNSFQCFWGNPKAYELKKRYVDYDLNRSFGINSKTQGFEAERARQLKEQIQGKFDFCIDLHTTTSNMGLTAILNNTHSTTRKLCGMLVREIPGLKLIEEQLLDQDCTHLNRLCPGGVTIEVGPVANNVISGSLVFQTMEIVKKILDFDFDSHVDMNETPYYKMIGQIDYPEEKGWYIHPNLERSDFKVIKRGIPYFFIKMGRPATGKKIRMSTRFLLTKQPI